MKKSFQPLPRSPLGFAQYILKRYWKWTTVSILAVIMGQSLATILTYIIKLLIDAIAQVQTLKLPEFGEVWTWIGVFLGTSLLMQICWRTSGYVGMQWITRVRSSVYETLFAYLTGHGSHYFANRFAGNLTNKVSNVAEGLDRMITGSLWNFLPIIVQLVGAIFLTALENGILALVLLIWSVIFILFNLIFVKRKSILSEAHAEASSELYGQMVDITTNISAVHHYAKRNQEISHLDKFIGKRQSTGLKSWFYSECLLVINGIFQLVLMGIMFSGLIYLWSIGQITVGAVVMVISLTLHMERSIFFIGVNIPVSRTAFHIPRTKYFSIREAPFRARTQGIYRNFIFIPSGTLPAGIGSCVSLRLNAGYLDNQ